MDQLKHLPRAIGPSVIPTMEVYEPLLLANATAIRSTKFQSFTYGSHPRQTLDVYYPSQPGRPSVSSANTPVLIFLHGGGFTGGSKTLPLADGLIHANMGHFYAKKLGYTTIIPDYRLMSHGARFPSGGEDLAQVVDWVRETLTRQDGYQNIELFIMGNSAGGVHMATYLFAPDFATSRNKVLTQDPDASIVLRGVVFLSVPFNFRQADASRAHVLQEYFGDIEANAPQGLLEAAMLQDPDNVLLDVRAMVIYGSLDPDDEILDPQREFLSRWAQLDADSRKALSVVVMQGQNHISPPLSLGTGIGREEAWGFEVGDFLDSLRK